MEAKPEKVMRSFEAEKEAYAMFKSILAKDGIDVGEKLNEFIKNFNRNYGDGNPAFTLDPFIKDAEMAAVPAVFRSTKDWLKWVLACDDEKFLQDIIARNQTILGLVDKRILELRGHTVKYV